MFQFIDSIADILTQFNLNKIASQCKFIQRRSNQIDPLAFIIIHLKSICSGDTSFSALARFLTQSQSCCISRQAIFKRVNPKAVKFLSSVAQKLIQKQNNTSLFGDINKLFNRILIEDCSVLRVHKSNHKTFPGNGNGKHKTAGAKLHQIIDWSNAQTIHSAIHHAREADQALSSTIGSYLQPGDLILRDMGFFKLSLLQKFREKRVHWISRLPTSIASIQESSGKSLNDILKHTKLDEIDSHFCLGSRTPFTCRIIARRLPKETAAANIRKRKADAKRRGSTPNKTSFLRDRWAIICTNIENDLTPQNIQALYQLRWNIEIQFRGIKQASNISKATNKPTNKYHLQCIFLSVIIYQIISFKWLNQIAKKIPKERLYLISYEKVCLTLTHLILTLTEYTLMQPSKVPIREVLQEKRIRQNTNSKLLTYLG